MLPSFSASGIEGEDVVKLLNNTTGTMMAGAHKENTCNIGVIIGRLNCYGSTGNCFTNFVVAEPS